MRKLVVVAHPDDELIYFGAQILGEPETEWTVVCVTDGDNEGRGLERKVELGDSCRKLGVSSHVCFDMPDKFDRRLSVAKLIAELRGFDQQAGPFDAVYTHDVADWHWHHQDVAIAVGHVFPLVWVARKSGSRLTSVEAGSNFARKREIWFEVYERETTNARQAVADYWDETFELSTLMILDCLPPNYFGISEKLMEQIGHFDVFSYHSIQEERVRAEAEDDGLLAQRNLVRHLSEHELALVELKGEPKARALPLALHLWLLQWVRRGKGDHAIKTLGLVELLYTYFLDDMRLTALYRVSEGAEAAPMGYSIAFQDNETVYDALAPWDDSFKDVMPGIVLGLDVYRYAMSRSKAYDLGYGAAAYKKRILELAQDGNYRPHKRPSGADSDRAAVGGVPNH